MPVPIMGIPDNRREDSNQVDYSFLANLEPASIQPKKKKVYASNRDAELLYKIWESGQKGDTENTVKVDGVDISSRDIMRLKTKGFLTGSTDEVVFTSKGKSVITTMVLGETNNFEKKRQKKSYTEILANMNKRGKPGFRMAQNSNYSVSNYNILDLRKIK
jgi:hypothetical protein